MFKSINKVIKILMLSDFFLTFGWGLITPVFAIFIVQDITGSAAEAAKVAGFAYLCYWVVKSIIQVPVGKHLDYDYGEKDDFWFVIVGTFFTGLVAFGYMMASVVWHIYALQVVHAFSMALVVPGWLAIFTRHIDIGQEAFEWGTRSTIYGLGAGIAGALGGLGAAVFGFKIVFLIVGILTVLSAFLLLSIKNNVVMKDDLLVPILNLERIFNIFFKK